MRFDIITIFPGLFTRIVEFGVLRRARQLELADVRIVDLRDFAGDRHKTVDDRPYGGGEGMVLMPAPLFEAVEHCKGPDKSPESHVALLTPQGKTWNQKMASDFATIRHLILLCGRYEGVDQRVVDNLVDSEVSIGDYVLSGGEIPALVMVESIVRLLPGVLGARESTLNESFTTGLLDYPPYTRPANFRGWKVPEVLLSGNHKDIELWRKGRALQRTLDNRPELIVGGEIKR